MQCNNSTIPQAIPHMQAEWDEKLKKLQQWTKP